MVVAEPADHVQVQSGRDVAQGNGRMGDPVLRAQQPFLLGVPGDEQDRPLGRAGKERERLGQFQHRRRSAGVVVGAGMDVSVRAEARAPAAVADVVVMGADDDHLVAQLRIAALENRQDVAEVGCEGLEEAAVVARRSQMDLGVLLGEVVGGGMAAARAGFAAFHRRLGQLGHRGPRSSALIESNAA